jgi:hypothetical protein
MNFNSVREVIDLTKEYGTPSSPISHTRLAPTVDTCMDGEWDMNDDLLIQLEDEHILISDAFWTYHGKHGGFRKPRTEEEEMEYWRLADCVQEAEKRVAARVIHLKEAYLMRAPSMKRSRRHSMS